MLGRVVNPTRQPHPCDLVGRVMLGKLRRRGNHAAHMGHAIGANLLFRPHADRPFERDQF